MCLYGFQAFPSCASGLQRRLPQLGLRCNGGIPCRWFIFSVEVFVEDLAREEFEKPEIVGFDIAGAWGLLGLSCLLCSSVFRVGKVTFGAWGPDVPGLEPWHWVFLAAWVGFMGYMEGYRGFQLGYSRRVVLRALALRSESRLLPRLLAPLSCMGVIYAPRRRLIVAWFIILAVIGIVTVVRFFPQPWRGLIDAGVVVGLTWGLFAMWANIGKVLSGRVVPEPVSRQRR
jgi:hypothetical protein